jgi:hypothetical protein
MDFLDLEFEEEEDYNSQEGIAAVETAALSFAGEEAKKSKRARPRAVGKGKPVEQQQDAEARAGSKDSKKQKSKRSLEKVSKDDPKPEAALAAFKACASYKDQHDLLVVFGTLLHCNLCGKSFGTRANVWKDHLEGKKHMKKLAERKNAPPIANVFAVADQKAEFAHRLRVAEAFFEAGIELSKCKGKLKELLEERRAIRLSVGDSTNLSRQVMGPLTVRQNEGDLAAVLRGDSLGSFIFDGYSRKDEHAAVVLRTCSSSFDLSERLVCCKMFQKGLTGKQWLRVVDEERRRLSTPDHEFRLVFTMADGHPSNGLVGEALSAQLENYFHSFCYSHSLAKVGLNCRAPLADQFVTFSGAIFKNSPGARAVFARIAGEEVKRKHKVRWFSTTGVILQALAKSECWMEIVETLERENLCKETVPKFKKLLTENQAKHSDLWLEMAAVYDATMVFHRATTFFEGSSFLAPFVWRYVRNLRVFAEKVMSTVEAGTILPNAAAIVRAVPQHVNTRAIWGKVRQTVDPGLEYFLAHFVRFDKDSKARQFKKADELFAFAQLFHPVYGKEWMNGEKSILPPFNLKECLQKETVAEVLGVYGRSFVQELTSDFSRFLTCLEQKLEIGKKYTPDEVIQWWRVHGSATGSWAAAARLFLLLQPSSASVERVFSMLRATVTEQQERMLEDQQELRIRMRFSRKESTVIE